jgi:hypothetical protein
MISIMTIAELKNLLSLSIARLEQFSTHTDSDHVSVSRLRRRIGDLDSRLSREIEIRGGEAEADLVTVSDVQDVLPIAIEILRGMRLQLRDLVTRRMAL